MTKLTEEEKEKTRGILGLLKIATGSSLLSKGIIVGAALATGYGSAIYFKGENVVTDVAQQVVQDETGVKIDFVEPAKN